MTSPINTYDINQTIADNRCPPIISVTTLQNQVVDALREELLSGALPANYDLNERRLAERFQVSTAPIREALLRLAGEGFATRVRRGMIASPSRPDPCLADLILNLRIEVESFAVRRLIQTDGRRDGEFLSVLQSMRAACESNDVARLAISDYAFHHLIVEIADLPGLTDFWRNVAGRLRIDVRHGLPRYRELLEFYEHHNRLVVAIIDGKACLAQETIREIIEMETDLSV